MTETLEAVAKAPTAYEEAIGALRNRIWISSEPGDVLDGDVVRAIQALGKELADEREIVRAQADVIADLQTAVSAIRHANALRDQAFTNLDRALDKLQPCPELPAMTTLEAFAIAPTIRLRINHSHTLKEGWRLSETTVEWTGPGKPDEAAIQDALLTAQHLGQREAALRNAPPVVEGTVDDDVAF